MLICSTEIHVLPIMMMVMLLQVLGCVLLKLLPEYKDAVIIR